MARSVPLSLQLPPHNVDARAAATAATSRALRAALAASLRSACSGFARASARLAVRRCAHRLCTVLRTSASATAPTSAHCRSRCSRHSCGRSCGAPPHYVRHCLAQCAPHRRPLNRRGGSDPPASPASIFRSFIQRESPIRPAGPALGSTPDAAGCGGVPWSPMSCLFGAKRGQRASCDCWTECMLWEGDPILLESFDLFRSCFPEHTRNSPEHTPEFPEHTALSAPGLLRSRRYQLPDRAQFARRDLPGDSRARTGHRSGQLISTTNSPLPAPKNGEPAGLIQARNDSIGVRRTKLVETDVCSA